MSLYELMKDHDARTEHVFDVFDAISTTPMDFNSVDFEQAFLKSLFIESFSDAENARVKAVNILSQVHDFAPFTVLRATSIVQSVATDLSETGIVGQQKVKEKDQYLVRLNAIAFLKDIQRYASGLMSDKLISKIANDVMNYDPSMAVATSAIYLVDPKGQGNLHSRIFNRLNAVRNTQRPSPKPF